MSAREATNEAANLNASLLSKAQNKRRKGPNWPSSVDKTRFSDFQKPKLNNPRAAF